MSILRKNIDENSAAKTSLKEKLGITNLEENQYSGVVVYSTLAELPATGTLLVSYKVSNDPTSSNNGYYHWDGDGYVLDASLANGVIENGNIEAVSGDTVYNSFLSASKNLFNKETINTGYYVYIVDGSLQVSPSTSATDYIRVEELTDYVINQTYTNICYYDASKVKISASSEAGRTAISTPENCVYIRLSESTVNLDLDTLQIEQGTVSTSYERYPYNRISELEEVKANHGYNSFEESKTLKEVEDNLTIDIESAQSEVDSINLGFDTFSINLFDKTTVTEGFYNINNGTTQAALADHQTSDFIPVTEGEIYKRTETTAKSYYFKYDSSYNYLGYQYSELITIPVGCAYLKVTYPSAIIDTMMFTTLYADTSIYRPYNGKYLKESYLENPFSLDYKNKVNDTDDFKSLSFIRESTNNLFNKLNVVDGYYGTDGITFQLNASFYTSDFMHVTEGETYKKMGETTTTYIYMYDVNKKPYSTAYVDATTITIPSTVAYVRLVILVDNIDKVCFVLSSITENMYIPFTKQTLGDYVNLPRKTKIDKVCWWLGDSITAGIYGDAYLTYLNQSLIFKTQYNIAISGSTWSHTGTTSSVSGNTIYNQVVNMIDLVDNSSYEIPELIIISCGTNDISRSLGIPKDVYDDFEFISLPPNNAEVQNVSGGIRYACDMILTNYPDAQIILVTPIQRGDSINNPTVKEISEIIIECGSLGSMEVIDAYSKSGIYGYFDIAAHKYLEDNLHPNTAGATKLANFLNKALKNIIVE